jgi:transmembrane sensor
MTIRDLDNQPTLEEREAHRWITLLVSGEATTADAEALKQWRKESVAHEAAFSGAARRWQDFGPAGQGLLTQDESSVWPQPQLGRRAVLGGAGALAASVAGYAMVRPPLGLWPSFNELTADYRTATGEQRQVTLARDVSVRMNTQTSLAIPSSPEAEEVNLIAGEASFAMPAHASNPFVVLARDGRTIASHARFDVRNVGLSVCVTCFDGEIRVEHGGRASILNRKQQVRYDSDGLQPVVSIDPVEASAWQDGFLIFRFTPLLDVVAEINRYRPGKVILMNPGLALNPVNGRFRIQRIDEVLVWIEQAFGAKSRPLPGGLLLLS